MKQLHAVFVALAGAAAAVPGIASVREFSVPSGSEPLFAFTLAAASAAATLSVYTLRQSVTPRSALETARVASVGFGVAFVLFIAHMWMTNKVLVTHDWRDQPARQFVPLCLPDSIETEVGKLGSRRAYIMEYGPDAIADVTNEWNTTVTLAALLLVHTALVCTLATVFTALSLRELRSPESAGTT